MLGLLSPAAAAVGPPSPFRQSLYLDIYFILSLVTIPETLVEEN